MAPIQCWALKMKGEVFKDDKETVPAAVGKDSGTMGTRPGSCGERLWRNRLSLSIGALNYEARESIVARLLAGRVLCP